MLAFSRARRGLTAAFFAVRFLAAAFTAAGGFGWASYQARSTWLIAGLVEAGICPPTRQAVFVLPAVVAAFTSLRRPVRTS